MLWTISPVPFSSSTFQHCTNPLSNPQTTKLLSSTDTPTAVVTSLSATKNAAMTTLRRVTHHVLTTPPFAHEINRPVALLLVPVTVLE